MYVNNSMLLGRDGKGPFQSHLSGWHGIRGTAEVAGFKYLDSEETENLKVGPLLLCVSHQPMTWITKIATPNHSFISLREKFQPNNCNCGGSVEHWRMDQYKDQLDEEESLLREFECSFNSIGIPFKETFITTDLTRCSPENRLIFWDGLLEADKAVKKIEKVYRDFLNGVSMKDEEFIGENENYELKVKEICALLPGDELRHALQIGCAQSLQELEERVNRLTKMNPKLTPQEEKALAPRKKKFFIF